MRGERHILKVEPWCSGSLTLHGMVRSRTVAATACLFPVIIVVDELQIDVVILGLSANTKASSLDTGENDANELAERCRVQRNDAIGTATLCVLGVDAVAWD
jgi:hypothetical protein